MSDAIQIDANPERLSVIVVPRPDPNNHRHRKGLTHLLDCEDVLHQRLTQLPATSKEAADLARALVATRQAIRREQMKPDPKPIEVEVEPKERRELRGPVEPGEA